MNNKTFICGMAEPEICLFTIEGSLSIPETLPDINNILAISATAATDEISCADSVSIKGKAFFQILYSDTDGIARSFDAECAFCSALPTEYSNGATICAVTTVKNIAYKEAPRKVDIHAEMSANVIASLNTSHCVASPGEDDVRILEEKHRLYRYCCSGKGQALAEGRINIPSSLPEVKEILLADGIPQINAIHKDIGRVAVEGELKLCMIYSGTDKNAPIQYMNETVPFSQIISIEGEGEPCVICAPAKIFVDTGEAPDTLNYSCKVDISVIQKEWEDSSFIKDAYSVNFNLNNSKCSISTTDMRELTPQKRIIRTGFTIPDILPEASRVLLCMVTPELTEQSLSRGSISLSGILHATVCYTTASYGVQSARVHLPFETELSAEVSDKDNTLINASCEYTATQGSGRELELRACLIFTGMTFAKDDFRCIEQITPGEVLSREDGILLYFADEYETDWDILSHFHIDPKNMRDMGNGRKMMIL